MDKRYPIKKCKCCGKIFDFFPEWRYRLSKESGYDYFCSWKCLRAYEKEKPRKCKIYRGVPKKADMRLI